MVYFDIVVSLDLLNAAPVGLRMDLKYRFVFRWGAYYRLHGCGLRAINSSGHMPPLYAQANAGVEVRDSGMVNRS